MYENLRFCIGDSIRLESWQHGCLVVDDIGTHSVWGKIVNIKTNEIMAMPVSFPLDLLWIQVLTDANIDSVIK